MAAEWQLAELVVVLAAEVAREALRLEQAFVAEVSLQAEVPAALVAVAAAVEWRPALAAEVEESPPVALEVVLAVEVAALA